jgi:soluble lytic murein transglycosylase
MEQIELLYAHAATCMKPADAGYESLHLRQGLLRHLTGNDEGARTALNLAAKAENSEEHGRVLYWQGKLAAKDSERDAAWSELTKKQPMTYHSLLVWKSQNKDPLEPFTQAPEKAVERVTPKLSGRTKTSVQWLEALYLAKENSAAEKLARWISSFTDEEELPAGAVIYLGALQNAHDHYRGAIKFLTDSVVKNPDLFSAALLKQLYPAPYLEVFDRFSRGMDTFLIMGLARQESAFNPRARSPARAEGVMQVLPRVARIKLQTRKRVNLYDVEINIRVGSKLLRDWIKQFGAVEYALIAYNAGPQRVKEWRLRYPTDDMPLFLDLIPFKETRNYVGSILRNNYWYHRLYENDPTYKALRLQHPENKGGTYYSQIVRDMIDAPADRD